MNREFWFKLPKGAFLGSPQPYERPMAENRIALSGKEVRSEPDRRRCAAVRRSHSVDRADWEPVARSAGGHWNTVLKRFRHWVKADVFKRIFDAVSDDPDMEYAMIDATIVKVHSVSACRSR